MPKNGVFAERERTAVRVPRDTSLFEVAAEGPTQRDANALVRAIVGAHGGERLEEGLEHPGPAQAPEALPHRVPVAEFGRKRPPGDVVEREVVQRLEELAVVSTLVAAPGPRGAARTAGS